MTAVFRNGRTGPPSVGTIETLAGDVMSATRIQTCAASGEKPRLLTSSLKSCGKCPLVRFTNRPLPTLVTNASNMLSRSARKATSWPSREIAASTSEPGKSVTRSIRAVVQRFRHEALDSELRYQAKPTAAMTPMVAAVTSQRLVRDRESGSSIAVLVIATDSNRATISSALCHRSPGFFSRHFITRSLSGDGTSGLCVVTGSGAALSCAERTASRVSPTNGGRPVNSS